MYKQSELKYSAKALEPVLDELTVMTHHDKHHATYTANLNDMAQEAGVADKDICELLGNLESLVTDSKLRMGIRNNGGGYYNHNLYFDELSPEGKKMPTGKLMEAIDRDFGCFEDFKTKMCALAVSQFGSGWAWLYLDKDKKLAICNTPNQDNPIILGTGIPIFTIDVWEHAYYLKYKNLRADYVKRFFDIVDWGVIEKRYECALEGKCPEVECDEKWMKKS